MTDHGKRDEIAFRGEALGKAKTQAELIGSQQRATFGDIMRQLELLAGDGIKIDPEQVSFSDDVDQAAWRRFIMPSALRGANEAPMMEDERTITLKAVQG